MYNKQNLRNGQVTTEKYLKAIEDELVEQSDHRLSPVTDNQGIHGVRAGAGYLDYKDGDEWVRLIGKPGIVYGVSIDLSNSNPETAVTYTDDAVGKVPGTAWLTKPIFRAIRPCLFKDGKVVGYLNPDNFAQFENGNPADITSGEAGDVMIEIPRLGYKIAKSGTTLTVQITNSAAREGFSYLSHTRQIEGDRDKLYVGAFLSSGSNDELRSVSGAEPLDTVSLIDFRDRAHAKGSGYDLLAFYPLTLIQCLYLIMYKNLNSQSALGAGYTYDPTWSRDWSTTGTTVDKGMCAGSPSFEPPTHVKFLGIEDLWGNREQLIDGVYSSLDYQLLAATSDFADRSNSYRTIGESSGTRVGYMSVPFGTNEGGFICSEAKGSMTTYFSDYGILYGGYCPIYGGWFDGERTAGIFNLQFNTDPGQAVSDTGCRLMYL